MAMADRLLLTAKGGATTECGSDRLRRLLILLGDADGDLRFMLPPFEQNPGAAAAVQDIGGHGLHGTNITAYDATSGHMIRGRMLSVVLNMDDEYWNIPDNALLSFGTALVDEPFSVGIAFKFDTGAAIEMLIAKDDNVAVTAREYALFLDAADKINMVLYDDSVPASEGMLYNTALVVDTWYVAIATYNGVGGGDAEAGVHIYLWEGVGETYLGDVADTEVTAGVYLAMEDLAEPVLIGARNAAAHADEWGGEICIPFLTARELSAADAQKAIKIMVSLLEL